MIEFVHLHHHRTEVHTMQDFLQNFEILYKNLSFFRDGNVIMIAIGCLLIYLAIAKDM